MSSEPWIPVKGLSSCNILYLYPGGVGPANQGMNMHGFAACQSPATFQHPEWSCLWEPEIKLCWFISSNSQKTEGSSKGKAETACFFLEPHRSMGKAPGCESHTGTKDRNWGGSKRSKQQLQTLPQIQIQVLTRASKCKIIGTWNCPFNFCIQLLYFHWLLWKRKKERRNWGWKTSREEMRKAQSRSLCCTSFL